MANSSSDSIWVPLATDNPQAVQVIYTDVICLALVLAWSTMRMYSRHIRHVSFTVDDGLYFVALLLYFAFVILDFFMIYSGGAGWHLADLPPSAPIRLQKYSYATQVLYALSLGLCKVSIILVLKRIFFIKAFKIICWVLIGFVIAWMAMTILIGLLICHPIAYNWDQTIEGGYCGDETTAFGAVAIVDLIIDFAILVLPMPMVVRLQISTAHKIGLSTIFGAGILTIIFGGLRLKSIYDVDFTDFTYTSPVAITWAAAEIGVALIISSSPVLRPVFDLVFGRFISSIRSSGRHGGGASGYGTGHSKSQHTFHKSLGATGTTLTNSRQHDGFYPMRDSEEALELTTITAGSQGGRVSDQQRPTMNTKIQASSRASHPWERDYQGGEGDVPADSSSSEKIYVKTEIIVD